MAENHDDKGAVLAAPFNMALSTLEKVHNLLKQIATSSVAYGEGESITPGQAQHIKLRLIKQLLVQSTPLLNSKDKDEWMEEGWKEIYSVKLKWQPIIDTVNNKVVGKKEEFSEEVDRQLDEITIEIQRKLQDENYFMPGKRDPRMSWNQD